MISRKALVRFILASCAFHVAFLSLAGMLISGSSSLSPDTFAVRLTDPPKKDEDGNRKVETRKDALPDTPLKDGDNGPEETVNLANPSVKYRVYLRDLRQRIESLWTYPRDAYSRNETGTAVVRFTIRSDGSLASTCIVSSSGSASLDRGAISVVQAAAPFAPFPDAFDLAMLHIVAKFEYELN